MKYVNELMIHISLRHAAPMGAIVSKIYNKIIFLRNDKSVNDVVIYDR